MKPSHTSFQNPLAGAARVALAGMFALSSVIPAYAFTAADADTISNSYNAAFYSNVGHGGNWYFKYDTQPATTGSGWWTYAEEIEMAEDVYDRTGSAASRNVVTALCNDFLWQYGSLWTSNKFNDDIAWAVIAFARAYRITGNTAFRDAAKANFDAIYARGWDTTLGGGIWWTTDKDQKNACINGPAAIGAYMLYEIYGDTWYLNRANEIYNWERNTLFNASTGQVYDNINKNGTITNWIFTYNQGTFIGAANYLGHTADATLAANHVKNSMCTNGILPGATENSDGGGFNGIFLRWTAKFMKDRNQQGSYLSWLQQNANAAWNSRRADGLSWCNWGTATPSGTRYAWGCSNSVIALQVIPADQISIAGTHVITSVQSGKAINNSNSTAQGAGIIQWGKNGGRQQKWAFTQNADSSWNIISQHSGLALENPGFSTVNGTQMDQWASNGGDNQRWWVDIQPDGSFKIWNKQSSGALDNSSSAVDGYKIVQWQWNGGNQQRWRLEQ
ncbi:MAG: hypothetical protein EOP88_05240 [Verrucomicrobiaceae bacterium]|nr:MAG: hypothetical protein EOP88_05240 [Verrucomicrobiaceae bacterium]